MNKNIRNRGKTVQQKKNRALTHQRNLDYIREYKEYHKCECGEGRAACLDLHHIEPTTKSFALSDGKTHSLKSIDIEIRKCIVLCANCHRLLHAKNQCEMKVKEAENEKLLF